jgi:nucleoside-diphosphate-sugar epimerase
MSRVLVTGATGFAGRATIASLAGGDGGVRAAVRRPPLHPFGDGVEVMQHPDLAQVFDWQPLLAGVDRVIHLAGIAATGRNIAPELYDAINRQATARLAAAAARAGVRHFVFLSSIRAQSGPAADHALTERDPAVPTEAYGRSKLEAEAALRASAVPFTILRPAPLYGLGVKGNFALLLRAALSRWPLPARDLVGRRSLLGIDNLVSALTFVLAHPASKGETYVIADPGIPPRLTDVIATLRTAQGRRALLLPFPSHYVEIPLRLLQRTDLWERFGGNLRVDPGKLLAAGWQPRHDTRAGLVALARAAAAKNSTPPSRQFRS